ncbi:MAG: hypothetical protein K2Y51_26090 [Gammaproteobacteria bacterium]|nr:hypothetical protein [Gammaproteobacteria bacterium]
MNLPLYKSHKTVKAAKINAARFFQHTPRGWTLDLAVPIKPETPVEETPLAFYSVEVSEEWVMSRVLGGEDLPVTAGERRALAEHITTGYYVQYEDGYSSWSPAEAFEAGYSSAEDAPFHVKVATDPSTPGDHDPRIFKVVHTATGKPLVEVTVDGTTYVHSPHLHVENYIPERIASAAAGGMSLKDLEDPESSEVPVYFMGDVDVVELSETVEGQFIVLRALDIKGGELGGEESLAERAARLEAEGSTMRCIIFEADQVHEEEEPEPEESYELEAQALWQSGFFSHPAVKTRVGDLTGRAVQSSGVAAMKLSRMLGYEHLSQVPPEAIRLWAADNGVADLLPKGWGEIDPSLH